ncbi:hypothetical protein BGZ76_004056 [Entomortierella beljakovae]|nr:hypothetical protein BGZ76_004056 [Entomortierella beljakovae]
MPPNIVQLINNQNKLIKTLSSEVQPSEKTHAQESWESYVASDGISVALPSAWISIPSGKELQPSPRKEFSHLKGGLKPGDKVTIPSIGQLPKDFGTYNSDILITEQMLELWDEMQERQRIAYRRVLSGPMGVGKSFLSYFLAARAYAEGWMTHYIADEGVLDKESRDDS